MTDRKTWPEICRMATYQGQWIALDNCRYDETTMSPMEGEVVDSDSDLSSLCSRMREAGKGSCAIHFCETGAHSSAPAAN